MKKSTKGAIIFGIIIIMSFMIGSYILTATFFGIITLIGLIALVESISFLKWILQRSTKVLDTIIFIITIIAMASYGLNVTAALTVAGLGYTLVYAPYLREQLAIRKSKFK